MNSFRISQIQCSMKLSLELKQNLMCDSVTFFFNLKIASNNKLLWAIIFFLKFYYSDYIKMPNHFNFCLDEGYRFMQNFALIFSNLVNKKFNKFFHENIWSLCEKLLSETYSEHIEKMDTKIMTYEFISSIKRLFLMVLFYGIKYYHTRQNTYKILFFFFENTLI